MDSLHAMLCVWVGRGVYMCVCGGGGGVLRNSDLYQLSSSITDEKSNTYYEFRFNDITNHFQ